MNLFIFLINYLYSPLDYLLPSLIYAKLKSWCFERQCMMELQFIKWCKMEVTWKCLEINHITLWRFGMLWPSMRHLSCFSGGFQGIVRILTSNFCHNHFAFISYVCPDFAAISSLFLYVISLYLKIHSLRISRKVKPGRSI